MLELRKIINKDNKLMKNIASDFIDNYNSNTINVSITYNELGVISTVLYHVYNELVELYNNEEFNIVEREGFELYLDYLESGFEKLENEG